MNKRHFQRYAKPTFECAICHRRTRLVGQGNDSLCNECWELAGIENEILDHTSTLEDIAAERDSWLAKAVTLGSDPERIKSQFSTLWPK